MAGGVGSRFWPKSKERYPKQFIDILGTGKSLLQMTVERFKPLVTNDRVMVITNSSYKQLVLDQLNDLPNENIICEPTRRNTAPCIAYAAFKLYKQNPDAAMVIVPSDHLILNEALYIEKIKDAVNLAEKEKGIVTLGIPPTRPDTGYGYIEYEKNDVILNGYKVRSFKEKPEKTVAEEYVTSGSFLWNAGMFIWKVDTIIDALRKHAPDIYRQFSAGMDSYNTYNEKEFIDVHYPNAQNISIDYAVMEKADNVYTIPAEIGWSDLGTWNALYEVYDSKDIYKNTLISSHVYATDSKGCMVSSTDGKLVVIDGLEDYIVVDEDDVLLIYPRKKEQQIKQVTEALKAKGLTKFI